MSSFKTTYDRLLSLVETSLPDAFDERPADLGGRVVEAARYSLLGGGKRIRPVLTLAASEMLGIAPAVSLPFAQAIEMIHTYSLIHDDLPCMDNDDLRRGKPTCHIVYGEAVAVLAGDALLNRAFEVMLESSGNTRDLNACRQIAVAAGACGMIGGQMLDLDSEGKKIGEEALKNIHRMKTGALIKAPVLVAASLANSDDDVFDSLERYADAIGLAFQIQDDILDRVSCAKQMGKSVGKDDRDDKSTYVTVLGLEAANEHLHRAIQTAHNSLKPLQMSGLDTGFLAGLADYLKSRET